jgi:GNAT superfamily N-acetyltransferase
LEDRLQGYGNGGKVATRNMTITYYHDRKITPAQFVDVLRRSTLAERRPVHDSARIGEMLAHANLICTAWDGDVLVGVSRSLTDFSYCCYLSDLAVDAAYQKAGIGKKLVELTQTRLHPQCKIILLAAPKAESYYPKIGFRHFHSAWVLSRPETSVGTTVQEAPL